MNIIRKRTQGLFGLLLIFCVSNLTYAQQNISSSDSLFYELNEIIISASRFEESPSSVGRNVTVIGKSDLNNSIHNSVGGVLAQQQSTQIVGNNQTPGSLQNVFLRSTNSNHTVVMIDGVRISDPSSTSNNINLSELSLAGVQRIEIVRGSHSTLYGSSAIGGVINIITKSKAETGIHANLDTQVGRLNGGANSIQNSLSVNTSTANGFYTNLAVTQYYTNGMDATTDTSGSTGFNPQDRDGFRKLDLFGKVGFKNSVFDVYGSYRRADQRTELDQGAFIDDGNAKLNFDRDLVNYRVAAQLSDPIRLSLDGSYSTLNRNFVNDSSKVDNNGNYDGIYTETIADGTLWDNELTATFKAEDLQIVAGVESSNQTMATRSYTFSSTFNFESETDLDSLNLKETINSAFIHADLSGRLLNEDWSPFSLVVGSRLADHNRFGSHLTYEVNPSVEIGSKALVYGALTTGFNAPSLYQLHSPDKGFGALTNRGNKNLKAEKSISYELGWKQQINADVQIELSLFRTDVSNVIEYVYLWNGDKEISNLGAADYLGDTYINGSDQHINGIELGADINLLPNLSFAGDLSYTNSDIVFDDGDIDRSYTKGNHVQIFESGVFVNDSKELDGLTRRPSFSANANLSYRPTPKWTVGVNTKFVGDRDDIFYSASLGPFGALDRSNVDSYNITDVSAQYRVSQNITLGAQVENLFNSEYFEIRGYQTRGRGFMVKASFSI